MLVLTKSQKLIVLLAFVVYTLTAIRSSGFYHADEHFQIIEFAQSKLGNTQKQYLAWEFNAHIRPAFQPFLAYLFFSTVETVGISDPYLQTMVLRLLMTSFALIVLVLFFQASKKWIDKSLHNIYLLATFFLWFLPFLSARFSSESLSGLLMLLGLVFIIRVQENSKMDYVYLGLFFGLSFLTRYQIAFAFVGFLIWYLLEKRSVLKLLKYATAPFFLVVLIGFVLDHWLYGQWVFTPWKYFEANILEGVAASFGVASWHYYLSLGYYWMLPPLGVLFFLCILILLVTRRNSLPLWITFLFLIGHSIIGHKEMRFIFPVVFLFPLLIMETINIVKLKSSRGVFKVSLYLGSVSFLLCSVLGITINASKGAGNGFADVTRYIHAHYGNEKITIYYTPWSQPYAPWGGEYNQFYREKTIEYIEVASDCDLKTIEPKSDRLNLFATRSDKSPNDACDMVLEVSGPVVESLPKWVQYFLFKYHGYNNQNLLKLYLIDLPDKGYEN